MWWLRDEDQHTGAFTNVTKLGNLFDGTFDVPLHIFIAQKQDIGVIAMLMGMNRYHQQQQQIRREKKHEWKKSWDQSD